MSTELNMMPPELVGPAPPQRPRQAGGAGGSTSLSSPRKNALLASKTLANVGADTGADTGAGQQPSQQPSLQVQHLQIDSNTGAGPEARAGEGVICSRPSPVPGGMRGRKLALPQHGYGGSGAEDLAKKRKHFPRSPGSTNWRARPHNWEPSEQQQQVCMYVCAVMLCIVVYATAMFFHLIFRNIQN